MLAAAASKTADVNANVLFFMLRFRFLFSLIKEFTVSRQLAANWPGGSETYIRENCSTAGWEETPRVVVPERGDFHGC